MRFSSLPALLSLVFLLLTACSLTRTEPLPELPTATTVRRPQTTAVATLDRQLSRLPDAPATPPGACPPLPAGEVAARHTVSAEVDYAARTVAVEQTIDYTNPTAEALDEIVLTVEPNRWPDVFTLVSLGIRGAATDPAYELTGRRLTVTLPDSLPPGCAVTLEAQFRLAVPPISGGIRAFSGFFGYSERQMNLGHWLPVVARHDAGEWIVRDVAAIGEQHVLESADWDVTVTVNEPPDDLTIAAPGDLTGRARSRWQWSHSAARDFAISLSDGYHVTRGEAESGVTVEVYGFDDPANGGVDKAAHVRDVATHSLEMYEDLYGPYRASRLVIVQGDFPDGMEFSGLVYVSNDWFQSYNGNPAAFLTVITAHEVAHQWWYAQVGNDAAFAPWLDEALSTYSEFVFIEERYPDLKDWWWDFRVNRYAPEGAVDSAVYDFPTIRAYINAVYLRGAAMLHDLRGALDTDPFFDWLAAYTAAGSAGIASPDLLWSLLDSRQLAAVEEIRARYLRAS